jgi:hypothetical protein
LKVSREERWPGGLSAAGRSSKDPATARKAEEKKRGQGARIVTQGDAAACNAVGNLGASGLHGRAYNLGQWNWQALARLLVAAQR